MNGNLTREVLFDYFAGNASALQKQRIDEWVKQPEAEETFYRWLDEWELTHAQYRAEVTPHLERFHAGVRHRPPGSPRQRGVFRKTLRYPRWLRRTAAAGGVLLLALLGVYRNAWLYQQYETSYNQTRSVLLSDGSRVTLNANSLLRIPRLGFGNQTRRVYLEGEAEFTVAHTATHRPFVVKTARELDVLVLGTEFTVFARPRASKVVLKRGKVRLRYRVGNVGRHLTLKPGDVMTLDPKGHARLQTTRQPEKYSAWKERRVILEETSLTELASLFEENYGIHLEIPDAQMGALTLSGSFTASDADELIRTVTDALGIAYRREANTIYLTHAQPR